MPSRPLGDDSLTTLPSNVEAEQALLGALLYNNDALDELEGRVGADHFSEPVHGRIFIAIAAAIDAGRLANPITILPQFEHDDALSAVGGAKQYLAGLMGSAVSATSAKHYADVIIETAKRRAIILAAQEAVHDAHDANMPVGDVLDATEGRLYALHDQAAGGGPRTMAELAPAVMAQIEDARDSPDSVGGMTTGIEQLDSLLNGMQRRDLIVVGARPSMGKTSFALMLGRSAAADGWGTLILSLEQSSEQLVHRLLSDISFREFMTPIPYRDIAAGRFHDDMIDDRPFERITQAERELAQLPITINDASSLTLAGMRAAIRAEARRQRKAGGELGLVVVDHLQLVGEPRQRDENDTGRLGRIVHGLKAMAKDFNVCVLLLSQLSRETERRDDKRPQLADLRQSGDIEQDADVVMFLYREAYYLERSPPKDGEDRFDWQTALDACHLRADIIVAKNRQNEAPRTVKAYCNIACSVFRQMKMG
jgi:replicative DNA helicase